MDDYYRTETLIHKIVHLISPTVIVLLYSHQKYDTRKYCCVFRRGVYKRLLCKHGKIMLIRLYVHVLMMMIRLFSGFYTVLLLYLDYT